MVDVPNIIAVVLPALRLMQDQAAQFDLIFDSNDDVIEENRCINFESMQDIISEASNETENTPLTRKNLNFSIKHILESSSLSSCFSFVQRSYWSEKITVCSKHAF